MTVMASPISLSPTADFAPSGGAHSWAFWQFEDGTSQLQFALQVRECREFAARDLCHADSDIAPVVFGQRLIHYVIYEKLRVAAGGENLRLREHVYETVELFFGTHDLSL